MRSLKEISERLEIQKNDAGDNLMWQTCSYHPLCLYLPEYIKEGHEADELTEEAIIEEMRSYMSFAVGKARNQRGISASRSIWKYQQWLWVLEDPLSDEIENYQDYGMEHLLTIADKYNCPTSEVNPE